MEVYKSQYLHMAFFAGQGLLEFTWLSESKMMYTEECKQELLNYIDAVHKHRPTRVLADMNNMFFTFSPEMQNWINSTIFPSVLKIGVVKFAFVVSNDFFSRLSTKQVMSELNGLKFNSEYFDHKETAKKWLLSAA